MKFNIKKITSTIMLNDKVGQVTLTGNRVARKTIKEEFLKLYPLAKIKNITSLIDSENNKKFYIRINNYSELNFN